MRACVSFVAAAWLASPVAKAQVEWFVPGSDSYMAVYSSARTLDDYVEQCRTVTLVQGSPTASRLFPRCEADTVSPGDSAAWQRPAKASVTHPVTGETLSSSADLSATFGAYTARIVGAAETVLATSSDWPATNSGQTTVQGVLRFRVLEGRSLDLVLRTKLEWTPGQLGNRGLFQLRGVSNDASGVNVGSSASPLSTAGTEEQRLEATLRPGVYELTWHVQNAWFPPVSARAAIDLDFVFTPWTCPAGDADRDGDALPDTWEEIGVRLPGGKCVPREYVFDRNGDARLDLGELPDPYRKDLYVEVDWMPGQEYGASAFAPVVYAFNNAPVANPDSPTRLGSQVPGIALHVYLDEEIDGVTGGVVCLEKPDCGGHSFRDIRAQYFMPRAYHDSSQPLPAGVTHYRATRDEIRLARQWVFRYALLAAQIDGKHALAGNAAANDFALVPASFYEWDPSIPSYSSSAEAYAEFAKLYPCTVYDLLGFNFMHELGHTLGLGHGGRDAVNNKPNYLSVMSYSYLFTFCARAAGGRLDYSRVELPTLNEQVLFEHEGIGFRGGDAALKSELAQRRTVFGTRLSYDEFERRTAGVTLSSVPPQFNSNCVVQARVADVRLPLPTAAADGPIDWDQDCRIDDEAVQADINGSKRPGPFADSESPVLVGANDWASVRFDFRQTDYYKQVYGE